MKSRLLNLLPARNEKGQVIVLMALMLVGLIGAAALVVDGGRAYGERRSVQNAADSAAMAAAWALCQSPAQDHVAAARASAQQNGLQHGVDGVTVMAWNPPQSGSTAGDDEYVEVVVSAQWQPSFMQVLTADNGPQTSSARAVARCVPGSTGGSGSPGGGIGVISLNPSGNQAVNVIGGAQINVTNGGVFVNSSGGSAVAVNNGGQINAQSVSVVGGVSGGPVTPAPVTGVTPVPDPLAGLAAPPAPANAPAPQLPTGCATGPVTLDGNWYGGWCTSAASPVTLSPGRYANLHLVSGHHRMLPGIYYIDGKFEIGNGANLVGEGVFIYVVNGIAAIGHNSGGMSVTLSAMTTGDYAGLLFFMRNGNSSDFIVGQGFENGGLTGTIYAPTSTVKAFGGSTTRVMTGQFVARNYDLSNGARLNITYDSDVIYGGGPSGPTVPPKIELSE